MCQIMTRINKKSTRTNNTKFLYLIYYKCKENKALKKGEKIMSDPLFAVCLDYVNQIERLEFDLTVMKGLMILWMFIAAVEFIILKVYKMKGERNYD